MLFDIYTSLETGHDMGLFGRKKVKKDSPTSQPREPRRAPQPCPPPPPSQGSQSWYPGSPCQQPASFEPAGLLTPPPSYSSVAPPSTTYQPPGAYPPIIVNQNHYYLGAPPSHQAAPRSYTASTPLGKVNLGSAVDLAKEICQGTCIPRLIDGALPLWHGCGGQLVNQGNAMVDEIYSRFDNVLTMIDEGGYNGKERDIYAWQPSQMPPHPPPPGPPMPENRAASPSRRSHRKEHYKGQTTAAAVAVSGSVFTKVDFYANSRLPMNLPPLKLYAKPTRVLGSESVTDMVAGTSQPIPCCAWRRSTRKGSTSRLVGVPSGMPTWTATGCPVRKPW